jgi:hypothetical protein
MAFSPAAGTVNGRVVVNTAAGGLFRLTSDETAWEKVGGTDKPRIVARLIPIGTSEALLVGGASRAAAGNVADIEVLKIAEKGEPISVPAPQKKD